MGDITVFFKREDYIGDATYFHEFIVWTDDHGDQKIIRGGPKSSSKAGLSSGGGSGIIGSDKPGDGIDIPFGSIYVKSGSYDTSSKDYALPGTDPGQLIIIGPDKTIECLLPKDGC